MVDLVKVRRKAKEKADDKKQKAAEQPSAPAVPATQRPSDPATRIAQFLETANERRVKQKQETRPAEKDQMELLTFEIAGELYAIDIEHVVEIVIPRPVTRVPNAELSVVGIISLRGTIVTLIDARSRLGHRAAEASGPDVRVIVVEIDDENMGFVVDRVVRVVKVEAQEIDPHPVVHTSEQDESVRGVFRHNDALTILLDLESLLGVVPDGTHV